MRAANGSRQSNNSLKPRNQAGGGLKHIIRPFLTFAAIYGSSRPTQPMFVAALTGKSVSGASLITIYANGQYGQWPDGRYPGIYPGFIFGFPPRAPG
jgi:hypothetical protein